MQYSNKIIEELLQRYGHVLKHDYEKYRNHVYRIFLNCVLLDSKKDNEDKYAIAAVFHDIAIWTDNTIDYLNPSIRQASIFLKEEGKAALTGEISAMIYWHHKLKRYTGEFESTVEVFRQADWIDVSLGWLHYNADRKITKANKVAFPNKGFHLFLVKKIVSNLFKHPFDPLPMFTK